MAEEKKPAAAGKPAPSKPAARRDLLPASESSDPAVHELLAQIEVARSNGNDGEVDRLTGRLADLGYE